MKKLLLLILTATTACETPEQAIKRLGGREAVCIRSTAKYNGLYPCRDDLGKFWICQPGGDGNCMPTDYPAEVFAAPGVK